MNAKNKPNVREQFLTSLFLAGIPAMRMDDCCRLLAIVYVIGGSMEAFTHNEKLVAEWKYAQKRVGLEDGKVPDAEAVSALKKYVSELETYYKNAQYNSNSQSPFSKVHPEWVIEFMRNRYGIKELWI